MLASASKLLGVSFKYNNLSLALAIITSAVISEQDFRVLRVRYISAVDTETIHSHSTFISVVEA